MHLLQNLRAPDNNAQNSTIKSCFIARWRKLASIGIVVVLCGCASNKALVTESKIDFNPATGKTTWALPKDFSGSWLEVKQSLVLTNGMTNNFSMVISNFFFRNNPMVLDSQANRDIQMMQVLSTAFQNGLQTGVGAAGKAVVPIP